MLIQSLERKTRLALATVIATVAGCVVICSFTVWRCTKLLTEERSQIYILDGEIPFLAERAQLESNFIMEAKAHIQLFHYYFFNLPADDDFIEWTTGKAMYMADGTALKQKQALTEKGFYSDILSSSAVCTIMCDSIRFDERTREFTYYGTQHIKRRTKDVVRSLVTTGQVITVPRTANNPHGLLITQWKTLENKDRPY
jgi:conjugative transposon TraK protein